MQSPQLELNDVFRAYLNSRSQFDVDIDIHRICRASAQCPMLLLVAKNILPVHVLPALLHPGV